jgi:hypothetical protein
MDLGDILKLHGFKFLYFLCEINVLGFESTSPTKLALNFGIAAVVIIFA